jgi:hypothetical protein
MKQVIRLTESDPHQLVREAVQSILNEYGENPNGPGQEYFGQIAGQALADGDDEKYKKAVNIARSKGGGPAYSIKFRDGMLNTMATRKNGDKFADVVSKRIHNIKKRKLTENTIKKLITEVVKDVLGNYVSMDMDSLEYPVEDDYTRTDDFKKVFNNQIQNAVGNEEKYDMLMRYFNGESYKEIGEIYGKTPNNVYASIKSSIDKLKTNRVLKNKISALLSGDYNTNHISKINQQKKSFDGFAEYAYGLYVSIIPSDKMRSNPNFPRWLISKPIKKNVFFKRLENSNVMNNMTIEGIASFIKDNWDEFVWRRIPHNWYRPGKGRKRIDDIYGTIAKNRLDSLYLPFDDD